MKKESKDTAAKSKKSEAIDSKKIEKEEEINESRHAGDNDRPQKRKLFL